MTAEYLRLRTRPDVLVVLGLVVALAVVGFYSGFLGDDSHLVIQPGLTPPPEALAERALLRSPYVFPRSVATVLAGSGPVGFVIALLGATSISTEFAWGTLRTALIANTWRRGFAASRLVGLFCVDAALVGALSISASALPLGLRLAGIELPSVAVDSIALLGQFLAVSATLCTYTAIGFLCGVATRSVPVGALAALATAGGVDLVSATLAASSKLAAQAVPGVASRDLATILYRTAIHDAAPGAADGLSPLGLAIVSVAWVAAISGIAIELLARRDITA